MLNSNTICKLTMTILIHLFIHSDLVNYILFLLFHFHCCCNDSVVPKRKTSSAFIQHDNLQFACKLSSVYHSLISNKQTAKDLEDINIIYIQNSYSQGLITFIEGQTSLCSSSRGINRKSLCGLALGLQKANY